MFFGWACVTALVLGAAAGERWRWADDDSARAASVRIDTKVRFVDDDAPKYRQNNVQADEIKEPTDTDGFYNRPVGAGSGRYPVRSEPHQQRPLASRRYQESDSMLSTLQYCKCVSTPECTPRTDLPQACASGMFLCCYTRPTKVRQNTEFFNDLDDDRVMLLPSTEDRVGAFPGPGSEERPLLVGPHRPNDRIPPQHSPRQFGMHPRPILVGLNGPTGVIGPNPENQGVGAIGPNPGVLVGPGGPSGLIGPVQSSNRGVLVGPDGPTGQIGPDEMAQRAVLAGPGGPTGVLGPKQYGQRQVLVGPGGPTGMIGPSGRGGRRPAVLAGPGGPTGLNDPYGFQGGPEAQPGLLVGPGGPTGIVGPGKRLLVGPGGPTGHIGPFGYGQLF